MYNCCSNLIIINKNTDVRQVGSFFKKREERKISTLFYKKIFIERKSKVTEYG